MVIIRLLTAFLRIAFLSFLIAQVSQAATYYIDYSGGSDSNSGTSKSSPWKRSPGMAGFSHSYSHSAGDRFIFKGGVTWPKTCFTMTISVGGSSASSRDYYGVDQSWYSGTGWSRPVFDFQQSSLGGAGVYFNGGSWLQFDNIELKNYQILANPNSYGPSSIKIYGTGELIISNCYIHDWNQPSPITSGSDGAGGGGVAFYSGGNIEVTYCKFDQAGVSGKCGASVRNVGNVNHCEFSNTTQGVLGGGLISDCSFHDFPAPSDPASHCNAIETFNITTVYNSVFYNLSSQTAPMLFNPDAIHQKGISRVYNCVMWNTGGQTPICLDAQNVDATAMAGEYLEVYNCTISSGGTPIRLGYRTSSPFGGITVKNCHLITSSTPIGYNSPAAGFGNVISHAESNNLVQTASQAASAGYNSSNLFQPVSGSSSTVNAGTPISYFAYDRLNRSRPQGGAWDVGAYEYGGSAPAPTATPTALPTATPTPTPTTIPTPTATPTGTPTTLGLSFNSADGVITSPFTASGNGIAQAVETVDPTVGGSAVYTITVPATAEYGIVTDVNCPNEGSNSFFVNIDAEPTTPTMIWDVAVTNGLERRTVSWRGTGTDTDDELPQKTFTLTQGTHQLILRGRESGAEIDHILAGQNAGTAAKP